MSIKLSVIIPCLNQQSFIEKTLLSVQNQSFQYWECIVIDDGSTDSSKEIIQSYIDKDSRFKYFYQTNQGVSCARNFGIEQAQGEYIHFLDADDLINDTVYEQFVTFLDNNNKIDLVYGYYRLIDINKKNIPFNTIYPKLKKNHIKYLAVKNIFPIFAAIYRKNAKETLATFDQALSYGEDWEFWMRLSLSGYQFCYLNVLVGSYRRHFNNASGNQLAMLKGSEKVLLINKERLKNNKRVKYTFDHLIVALHLSAFYRAVVNHDCDSIAYLENKVNEVTFKQLIQLCFYPATLPAVLNYAETKRSGFIYYLFYIPIQARYLARKIVTSQ